MRRDHAIAFNQPGFLQRLQSLIDACEVTKLFVGDFDAAFEIARIGDGDKRTRPPL
jgi:hypothetical protein